VFDRDRDRDILRGRLTRRVMTDIPIVSLHGYADRWLGLGVELRVRRAIITEIERVVGASTACLLIDQLHAEVIPRPTTSIAR